MINFLRELQSLPHARVYDGLADHVHPALRSRVSLSGLEHERWLFAIQFIRSVDREVWEIGDLIKDQIAGER